VLRLAANGLDSTRTQAELTVVSQDIPRPPDRARDGDPDRIRSRGRAGYPGSHRQFRLRPRRVQSIRRRRSTANPRFQTANAARAARSRHPTATQPPNRRWARLHVSRRRRVEVLQHAEPHRPDFNPRPRGRKHRIRNPRGIVAPKSSRAIPTRPKRVKLCVVAVAAIPPLYPHAHRQLRVLSTRSVSSRNRSTRSCAASP